MGKLSTSNIDIQKTASIIQMNIDLTCEQKTLLKEYIIHYSCSINNSKQHFEQENKINVAHSNIIQLRNLSPYTTYKISLNLSSENATFPSSDSFFVTTAESEPSSPKNVTVSHETNTSIILHWDAPEQLNGILTSYKVLNNKMPIIINPHNFTANKMEYKLQNLLPFTEYNISMVACTANDSLCSNRSNLITVKTKVGIPDKMDQPDFIDINGTTLIKWKAPQTRSGPHQYYILTVKSKGSTIEKHVHINDTKCTLKESICSGESKTFIVRAVNIKESSLLSHNKIWSDRENLICEEPEMKENFIGADILYGPETEPRESFCRTEEFNYFSKYS